MPQGRECHQAYSPSDFGPHGHGEQSLNHCDTNSSGWGVPFHLLVSLVLDTFLKTAAGVGRPLLWPRAHNLAGVGRPLQEAAPQVVVTAILGPWPLRTEPQPLRHQQLWSGKSPSDC